MKTKEEKRLKAQRIKEKLQARELARKTKKQFSRSKLIKEADRIFSLYIRGRDQWKPCCTCGAKWTEQAQCWHFMSRRYTSTKWIEKNAHGQCFRDNMILSGEQYKHWQYIDKLYWEWTAQMLHDLAVSDTKVTDSEILETIQHYYKKCFELGIDYKPKKQFLWNN